jgi:hypothetical protein
MRRRARVIDFLHEEYNIKNQFTVLVGLKVALVALLLWRPNIKILTLLQFLQLLCISGLRVFETRVLRRIFGPKRDEVTGDWRKLHDEELAS